MEQPTIKRLNIENLIPGMRNVDVIGKITKITKRYFETDKAKGKLSSIFLIDETGSIRLTLWDDEVDRYELSEGDVIHVSGYVRQGLFGPELRLGRFGKIEKTEEKITRRAKIADLKEGQRKELRAAIVQLFESNPFYEICPKCKSSLKEEDDKFICEIHGEVEPDHAFHISGIIDDGSDNIRCVLFREQAEFILGVNPEEAKDIALRKGVPELFKNARLGEYILDGQVRRNQFFDRLEFVVNKIREVDIKEEIELLMEKESY